jgi:4a-hydroxytetrahydrobiopterin dehydratase
LAPLHSGKTVERRTQNPNCAILNRCEPARSYVETLSLRLFEARTPVLSMAPLSARIAAVISDLATKACVPCRGGVPPLKGEELAALEKQVDGWNVIEEHHLAKTFTFPDFREALKFVNRVGELAEEQGHHPDLFLAWGKVEITTWTHKINGLTENDFILAAKIDQLHKS